MKGNDLPIILIAVSVLGVAAIVAYLNNDKQQPDNKALEAAQGDHGVVEIPYKGCIYLLYIGPAGATMVHMGNCPNEYHYLDAMDRSLHNKFNTFKHGNKIRNLSRKESPVTSVNN